MKSKKSRKRITGMRVVRVTKTEFELDNGDIYPLPFELDKALSLKEFNEIYANSKIVVDALIAQSKGKNFKSNEKSSDN
jgi:hypothetical protein